VFRILAGILWLAPIGAFGAMAKVVGDTGFDAVIQMLVFDVGLLPHVPGLRVRRARRAAALAAGVSVFKLVRYLAREYLLIVATSSSESALPRLIAKVEHAGVQPTTVGIVVPTGYSFNGNAVATVLIGAWTQSVDHRQMHKVLDGDKPFDERTMVDDATDDASAGDREPAKPGH
jgi:aerobic C4-dicarboxylate transport protein